MNDENLKKGKATQFRSGEEAARTNGAKGGIASGISRSFRSATKKRLREHPELFEEIITMLMEKSLDGDLKAFELVLELSGESPKQMELALKKRELKLKEQAMQAGATGEQELPALLKALEENN
ncbi:MAG: hypothetical protein K2H29_04950 [Oscillospiraceae bacterium]|nr:hypothetical protein [Oscillospiraceae bacterium]